MAPGQDSTALALFVTHRGALVNYANGIVGDLAQAEDVVQEAWLRYGAAMHGRRLEEPVGYLYRIVRNLALDVRRQIGRERTVMSTADFDAATAARADDAPGPERAAISKNELERVLAAMAELPERTRIALEMHRFGGCKLREIAAALGVSIPLAHILVAEGVQHCKSRLKQS